MSDLADTDPQDIRPVVPLGNTGNFGLYAFIVVLLVGGALFFSALYRGDEARAPTTAFGGAGGADRIASPPPLVLPPDYLVPPDLAVRLPAEPPAQMVAVAPGPPAYQAPPPPAAPPYYEPPQPSYAEPVRTVPLRPTIVFERNRAVPVPVAPPADAERERVAAARLANPALTVPQGTIIPAVLETAFDSTQEGAARALVQRDIYGFTGTRVLIPRGSRLYGTYDAGINAGERRAAIRWTRLVRPDGVTIALDSPASDPLGRAGVEGDVNSHFWGRFGSAILQSVLDIGVGVATSRASDGVYVALPGSTQTITRGGLGANDVRPVLEVDQGTSVSVFVARDLDFSSVES